MTDEFRLWMEARCLIEDVEIGQIRNVGAGGKVIVGRSNATKIMQELNAAGYQVIRAATEQEASQK